MKRIRLLAIDGTLYFPTGGPHPAGEADLAGPDWPSLLTRVYTSGDCDTVPWPLSSPYSTIQELYVRLAVALYDERESNDTWPLGGVVIELPDGREFDFDAVLVASNDNLNGRI